jgi:hypothetical protein
MYEFYEVFFCQIFEVNVVGVTESVLNFLQSGNCPVRGLKRQISQILDVKVPQFGECDALINYRTIQSFLNVGFEKALAFRVALGVEGFDKSRIGFEVFDAERKH